MTIDLGYFAHSNGDEDPSLTEESPFHEQARVQVAETAEKGSFEERFSSRRVDLFRVLEHGIPPLDHLPGSTGIFLRGKRHLIPAPRKTGKTLATLIQAVDICAAGGRVVILDRENGRDEYARRLGQIVASRGFDDQEQRLIASRLAYYEFPKIRDYDRVDLVAELEMFDLVVFDSSRRFLTDLGLDEDKSDDYTRFMAAAVDPLFEAGIATLILDNTGHEEAKRARGSSAKEDLNEITFTLETIEPYSQGRVGKIRMRLEPGRSRFGIEGTWEMTIGGGVFGGWDAIATEDAVASAAEQLETTALDWIVAYVRKHVGAPKTDVVQAFAQHHGKGGRSLADRVIETALRTGSGSGLQTGRGKVPNGKYLYPASELSFPLPEPSMGSAASDASGAASDGRFPASPALESREGGKQPDEAEVERIATIAREHEESRS